MRFANILLRGQQGLETLLRLSKEMYTSELGYVVWIVKCYISTNSSEEAWDSYLQIEDSNIVNEVLRLIGNECYKIGGGMFLYSTRTLTRIMMGSSELAWDIFATPFTTNSRPIKSY
jgi:hypothetical protein